MRRVYRLLLASSLALFATLSQAEERWLAVAERREMGHRLTTLLTSTTGRDWRSVVSPETPAPEFVNVAHEGGRFYGLGSLQGRSYLLTSADGAHWDAVSVAGTGFTSIAWGRNIWIAATHEQLWLSMDGVNFEPGATLPFRSTTVQVLAGDTEAGFRFFIRGDRTPPERPYIAEMGWTNFTTDGHEWLQQEPGGDDRRVGLRDVTYFGGNFLRVSSFFSGVRVSHDGNAWQRMPLSASEPAFGHYLLNTGDHLYAIGEQGSEHYGEGQPATWISEDGFRWVELPTPLPRGTVWVRGTRALSNSDANAPTQFTADLHTAEPIRVLPGSVLPVHLISIAYRPE